MFRPRQLIFTLSATLVLAACGGSGGGDAPPPPVPTPAPVPAPPAPAPTLLRVKVVDVLGFPKAGAAVSVVQAAAAPVITGASGEAQLPVAPDSDQLVAVQLDSHTRQIRAVRVAAARTGYLEVSVLERAPALTLADAAAGGTLTGHNAVRITLPPAALVDAVNGSVVAGPVQIQMTPVNTNSHELRAFPGTMRGLSNGINGNLATYGPVEFRLMQDGRPLQLAAGQKAVIEMPLYATLWPDGTALAAGQKMAVWALNETTGIWQQEGEGDIVASRSASGLALRAAVGHFSWWNPDHFADPVRVRISFTFPDGVTPTDCCHVEGSTFLSIDNEGPGGLATTTLPPTGGEVIVNGGAAYLFAAAGDSAQGSLFNVVVVNVPLGSGTVDVTIPLLLDENPPNPVITNPVAGIPTYTNATIAITATVSGDTPDAVELRVNGSFAGTMTPNADATVYTYSLDTTQLDEGAYSVVARALRDQKKPVDSAARTVVVDRTPPQVETRSPPPGANQVTAAAVITATFSEPIDPASLVNAADPADLRIALLQGGPASSTALPLNTLLSDDARTLTLTPASPLPTNTLYAVRLQGLTDRAGNALQAVVWSFSVPLFSIASPDLNVAPDGTTFSVRGRPAMALDALGQPVMAWASQPAATVNRIEVRRRIGTEWVALPALDVSAPVEGLSMDTTPGGQPVVAWVQATPNTVGCGTDVFAPQLFAAAFNGSAWVALGSSLNTAPCSRPELPALRVDSLGRPVLASRQGPLFTPTLPVMRFEGGAWVALGNAPVGAPNPNAPNIVGLALALQGNVPLVLSSENRVGQIEHHVARLEGTAFVRVGPRVALGSASRRNALAVDAAGRPVAAVVLSSSQLAVLRFDGTTWQDLGALATTGVGADDLSIIFDAGAPTVAWRRDLGAFGSRYDEALGVWAPPFTIQENVGTLSELKRASGNGPVWLGLTSGPFRCCLRAMSADTLPQP